MLVRLQGYMTLAFLFMLFLVGCSKDSLTTETVFQANGDFFDLQRSRGDLTLRESYPISANPILRSVVSDLSAKNAAQNFTNNYISRVGYPMWLESKIYQDGPTGPPVVFIPFARDGADSLSGLLVAYRNPLNGQYRYNPMSRERLLSVTDAEYPQYRYYLKQFVQMNEKIFRKSSAGMSSRICRGEGLLGQYTPPGVINPVECPWRLINLCYDDDRRITYIAGHLPIHLDHDMDGIPNWEDQDWNDFLSRHPNINNFEQAVRDYWEENMEDLYGEYDDFWDAYSYPELNGGLEIDFSDWIDFWEDFWDDISDGWDDFWDWVDYQFEPEPDCWDPVQGGSLETREVQCDWLYVRDCDGDWRNGFDDVTVCNGCTGTDDCQKKPYAYEKGQGIQLRNNLKVPLDIVINAGDKGQCWCAPTETAIEQCVLDNFRWSYLNYIMAYYDIRLSYSYMDMIASNCNERADGFERCVMSVLADYYFQLLGYNDNNNETKTWLLNHRQELVILVNHYTFYSNKPWINAFHLEAINLAQNGNCDILNPEYVNCVADEISEDEFGEAADLLNQIGYETYQEKMEFLYDMGFQTYDDAPCPTCSVGQREILFYRHNKARERLKCIIEQLSNYDGTNPSTVRLALDANFGGNHSKILANVIKFKLSAIRKRSIGVTYAIQLTGEGLCGTSVWAWAFPGFQITDIRLCDPVYWNGSEQGQWTTLIHEWMHQYQALADVAYHGTDEYETLSTIQHLVNADSYAEFVKSACP